MRTKKVHVLFDGPPGPISGRFIDVVDDSGKGVAVGRWSLRENGIWALTLRIPRRSIKGQR